MAKTVVCMALLASWICLDGLPAARADVTLPQVISDGMVLQREVPVLIFGTAPVGENVTVSFRGESASTTSDGTWRVELPAQQPGGPFALSIQGKNRVDLKDVYVGDVWVAAGQSNMALWEWQVEPAKADPQVRLFNGTLTGHKHWPKVRWGVWGTSGPFSEVGWYFAHIIHEKEKVPLGILHAAQGGTAASEWLPEGRENRPYQTLVRPLQPFRIKGVIWWQGENDTWGHNRTEEGREPYHKTFAAVIAGWRKAWGQGDFPFLFVQLQSRAKPGALVGEPENGPGWQLVRDGQRLTAKLPNTAMVVAFDVTPRGELHPTSTEKQVVARRLARAAEAVAYGRKVEWSGPLLRTARRTDTDVVLTFTHVGKGLIAKGGELKDFQIKPADGEWRGAAVKIVGETVVIPAEGLKGPLRVRYGYRAHPIGNLCNAAGLPASPFLTDGIEGAPKDGLACPVP